MLSVFQAFVKKLMNCEENWVREQITAILRMLHGVYVKILCELFVGSLVIFMFFIKIQNIISFWHLSRQVCLQHMSVWICVYLCISICEDLYVFVHF